ncbi:glycoside hydrolase family 2 TIM barrel-domain containing protein [Klebsiella pneumoniae]|uniref:glycoside hydrolase family 2 TIM barrel-domain containing protein n=1 Tax=Klebsiella pneumoniae TaxID=573 RepID=UPI002443281D|nr:glycoside hydrolase family 2 TIM barrel-domain containing protein [Klebsiella pneumoniae]WGF94667.1 glycoside hydrolase family 2 TIM barrel-domain containing protein [Klebsiella pneumoniae]
MPGETRPLILCEYAHAMGNSLGGFAKYWQAFRQYPPFTGRLRLGLGGSVAD